jgi:hypothetical protein
MVNKEFSAGEILEQVYKGLRDMPDSKEIKLLSDTRSLLATETDWHTSRYAWSYYEKAVLLRVNGKEWAITLGVKSEDYLADPYNSDIAAVPISTKGKSGKRSNKRIAEEIRKALQEGIYLHNSLICAMADGSLRVNKNNPFGSKISELLHSGIEEFIAQPKIGSVVKSGFRYKKELVEFLVDTFLFFLGTYNTARG